MSNLNNPGIHIQLHLINIRWLRLRTTISPRLPPCHTCSICRTWSPNGPIKPLPMTWITWISHYIIHLFLQSYSTSKSWIVTWSISIYLYTPLVLSLVKWFVTKHGVPAAGGYLSEGFVVIWQLYNILEICIIPCERAPSSLRNGKYTLKWFYPEIFQGGFGVREFLSLVIAGCIVVF